MRVLDDLRVLDLSGQVAGPFCARLLGDFGADVIKVEPPGGEAGRSLPPLLSEERGAMSDERDTDSSFPLSAFFLYLNANKRGITLDLEAEAGSAVLRRLIARADVVVESFPPGLLERIGLGFETMERLRPGIILTSVTPFGQTGPWRDLPADDLIVAACSGWMSINGSPDREPLKPSGYQASFQAGLAAFNATLAAVVHRDRIRGTGAEPRSEGSERRRRGEPHGFPNSEQTGQQVDVSLLEPSVASFAPALLRAQYQGEAPGRQHGDFQRGPVPAADGYFSLTLSRAHFWRDAMTELGLPDLAADPRWGESSYRQEHHSEVAGLVGSRIAARGKRELFDALGALRVVGGMVLDTAELFDDPHVQARGFFVEQDHPQAGRLRYPGAPFRMSATPWSMERPAPALGQHTDDVLTDAGLTAAEIETLRAEGIV
jgi:CoA:oxalate CoA-transferase